LVLTKEGFDMSNSAAHIAITFKAYENSCEMTTWYTVTLEQERAWKLWLAAQATPPSDEAVDTWLNKNGAKLDRADGPAVVMNFSDGSRIEEWWANDKLHRVGSPALIETNANGSQREQWYTNDKLDRADGPAIVVRDSDGTILFEQWHHDGVLEKSRGLAPRGLGKPPSNPAP
jgi:hypothetical protein